MSKIKDYLRFKNMNVSNARRNVPKDIKSLKSNFISTTPILCRMKVKPPCTRLLHNSIVAHQYTPHKRTNKKSLSALFVCRQSNFEAAEEFGKQIHFPNGIRSRNSFPTRKTAGFKAFKPLEPVCLFFCLNKSKS